MPLDGGYPVAATPREPGGIRGGALVALRPATSPSSWRLREGKRRLLMVDDQAARPVSWIPAPATSSGRLHARDGKKLSTALVDGSAVCAAASGMDAFAQGDRGEAGRDRSAEPVSGRGHFAGAPSHGRPGPADDARKPRLLLARRRGAAGVRSCPPEPVALQRRSGSCRGRPGVAGRQVPAGADAAGGTKSSGRSISPAPAPKPLTPHEARRAFVCRAGARTAGPSTS